MYTYITRRRMVVHFSAVLGMLNAPRTGSISIVHCNYADAHWTSRPLRSTHRTFSISVLDLSGILGFASLITRKQSVSDLAFFVFLCFKARHVVLVALWIAASASCSDGYSLLWRWVENELVYKRNS